MTTMNWSELWSRIKALPAWTRVVIITLVAAIVAIMSLTSCSTVKTTLYRDGNVTTSVNQSVLDSTRVTISLFAK